MSVVRNTRTLGGESPSALGLDATGEKRTAEVRHGAKAVTLLTRMRPRADYVARSGALSSRRGVALTTTQVMPAANAIIATMNTIRPSSPRAVATTDLE